VAEDWDRWRAVVNAVMAVSHNMGGIAWLAENRLASQEGLYSME
jgi:hypothetical protein